MAFFLLATTYIRKHMSKRVRNVVVPFNAQEATRPAKAATKAVSKRPSKFDQNDALLLENAELRAALLAIPAQQLHKPVPENAVLPPPVLAPVPVATDFSGVKQVTTQPLAAVPVPVHVASNQPVALPVLEARPAGTFTRLAINEIAPSTDFTRLAVYGRVVEVSPITNKPVQGGHRQLWWIWIVDMHMSIQISIWSAVGTPRGDPPLIPRVGEVVCITGFSGVLSNGQWDKWHPCQLQAESLDLKFAYPGADASLLWDKQLNPGRTIPLTRRSICGRFWKDERNYTGFLQKARARTSPKTFAQLKKCVMVLFVILWLFYCPNAPRVQCVCSSCT